MAEWSSISMINRGGSGDMGTRLGGGRSERSYECSAFSDYSWTFKGIPVMLLGNIISVFSFQAPK